MIIIQKTEVTDANDWVLKSWTFVDISSSRSLLLQSFAITIFTTRRRRMLSHMKTFRDDFSFFQWTWPLMRSSGMRLLRLHNKISS